MTLYLLGSVVGLLLLISVKSYFWPIVGYTSSITTNYPFHILINRDEPYPAAVLAQEVYELRFRLRRLIVFSFFGRRDMELMSHAMEIMAAERLYGANPEVYMAVEVRSMRYPWLKEFFEMQGGTYEPLPALSDELRKRFPAARMKVAAMLKILERHR